MRFILDTMAALSFIGVVTIGIGGAYVYSNRDGIIQEAKQQVTQQVQEAVLGSMGGGVPGVEAPAELPGMSLPF